MIGSDCPVPAGQFGNDTVPYQPNPISYPNAPTGFIAREYFGVIEAKIR